MNWFRKSLLGLAIASLGGVAVGQQPGKAPARSPVGLGRPMPLATPASVFEPIRADRGAYPPPTVVRGVRPLLDDETSNEFLPRNLPPLGQHHAPPLTPAPPSRAPRPATDPMSLKEGFDFFRVDKNVVIEVLPEAPPARLPRVVDASSGPIIHAQYCDERVILVDETGNPLVLGGGSRWYGQADWLLWWTKGFYLPPLITTANATDPERSRGALGVGTTRLIFGNENTPMGPRSGGRFTVGRYLDDCSGDALEASFLFLGSKNDSFIASSANFPVLARPFFNVNTGQSDRELVTTPATVPTQLFLGAGPGVRGTIQVESSSILWGAEANFRRELAANTNARVTGILGFRYLDLSEQLGITERSELVQIANVPFRVGDRFTVQDSFATRNHFYGGQLGLNAQWQRDRWTLDARAKVAFGATTQVVDISGAQQVVSLDGRRQSFNGGLYALDSNSGRHSQTRFSAVPELGFKVGYYITDNVRLYAGYDFLYWGNVLRPGDQIDQKLDANRVPNSGAADPPANVVRPVVPFRATNFWAQGVSAGLEVRY